MSIERMHQIDSKQFHFEEMTVSVLPEVVAIEHQVHVHPWTIGNFEDALKSGYTAEVLFNVSNQMAGYFVCMPVIDEWHLLDVSVPQIMQGQGIGRHLMARIIDLAKEKQMQMILLEVRVSNTHAIHLYERSGFVEIGRRKNYYPVDAHTREDAIMMQLTLIANT